LAIPLPVCYIGSNECRITGSILFLFGFLFLDPSKSKPIPNEFENLQEIRIIGESYSFISAVDILPVLRLPRMQLLAVDGFEQIGSESEKLDAANPQGEKFSVKTLAFFRAKCQPQSMGWLLTRCLNLTTFVWEDYTRNYYYDSDERADSDNESLESSEDHGKQDTEFDEVLDLYCSVGESEWPWAPECEPADLFKPSLILALLAETHGNTLDHLGMTINNYSEMTMFGHHI